MPETTQYVFNHREVVTALLKEQGIHEGIWGLYVRFGLKATNFGSSPDDVMPVAIIPLLELGIQKRDKLDSISVDAAKVNPAPASQKAGKGRTRGNGGSKK